MASVNCSNCNNIKELPPSKIKGKKRIFCNKKCYADFMRDKLPIEEHPAWSGGITPQESRRRWYEKNKAKANAQVKARKLRELNAPGTHTKEDWEGVKKFFGYQCAMDDHNCSGSLTKDHIQPLIMGGSNGVENLQPLCRWHNTQKARKVYLGQFDSERYER